MKQKEEIQYRFFECSFPLSYWAKGTDDFKAVFTQISDYMSTLDQLNIWYNNNHLIPRPSLSNSTRLFFLVNELIVSNALQLKGVSGGDPVDFNSDLATKNQSSILRNEKCLPRPKRVLLDLNVDRPEILIPLKQKGIEIIQIWDLIADLVQYEIIETCINQYIDLIITSNTRLFTSSEEWINYLLPHRTRICYISEQYLANPSQLTELIIQSAHSKKRYKSPNRPIYLIERAQPSTKQSGEDKR
ncbi:hypothetical protein CEE45_09060 [Candidatus Heimdallarchaeota archaeon B3_Heim]|nr:MAG: hypothetical protein CEE45_09060 [Candidatus Heimdallarchaeota archaeon B3_Heim]